MHPARTYETLNGLRGIAALVVVMYHYGGPFAVVISSHAILAVDLFFAISGVIMAHVYEARLREGLSVGRFMLARFVRLYPLYIAGTVVAILTVIGALIVRDASFGYTAGGLASEAVPAIFMLPGYGGANAYLYPLNVPAWSLFYELLANVAFAVAAPRLTTERLLWVTGAFAAYLVALAAAGMNLAWGWTWIGLPVALGRVGFSFTVGLLLYRLHRRGTAPVPTISPATALVVTGALILAPDSFGTAFSLAAILFFFPAIVWIGLHNEPRRTVRVFALLGAISYPLYTLHVPVMIAAKTVLHRTAGISTGRAGLGGVLIATLLVAVLAWAADRWFDVPVRGWLSRATRRRRDDVRVMS